MISFIGGLGLGFVIGWVFWLAVGLTFMWYASREEGEQ